MHVALHPGAHRTATTSFQAYLRANRRALTRRGLGFWAPWKTRGGLIASGAAGLQTARARSAAEGTQTLVISEENIIGTMRACLRARSLYPDAAPRVARLAAELGGVDRIVLQIRPQADWWASVLAYLSTRGVAPPDGGLPGIAASARGWRHVIGDIAGACPGVDIRVTRFDAFADAPHALLTALTDASDLPTAPPGAYRLNSAQELTGAARPDPFTAEQNAALAEAWQDDLFWLAAGAGGHATLTEAAETGHTPAAARHERGHDHEQTARRLARHR